MKILSFILLIFVFSDINSQFTESNFDPEKIRSKTISISQKHKKQINPGFTVASFEIIDGRFDTTIGYVKNFDQSQYLSLRVINIDEIINYFNSHFEKSSSDSTHKLLCVIKKLFLSNNIYEPDNGKLDNTKNNLLLRSGGIVKLEFFANVDGIFIPLYRFDSTITGSSKVTLDSAPDYLSLLFSASLKKLETFSWDAIQAKRRKINRSTIDSSILKAFDLSVLRSPIKGIYFKFEDFINNKPTISEYSIVNSDKADFLYIKDAKNNETLQTNIWGYCDGKDFFVYTAENFFRLHPIGKTFAIYGAKDYRNVRVFRINFGSLDAALPNSSYAKSKTKSKYKLIHETLVLDMETGEMF